MTTTLNAADFAHIINSAVSVAKSHGHGHYSWKDDPAADLDRQAADAVWKAKLDGAYGERLLASLGMLAAAVAHGYPVRFVQFKEESGTPFDASGWTAVAVGGERGWWTVLHLAPWDFSADGLDDIVETVPGNGAEDGFVAWEDLRPTKPAEYSALLAAAQAPGLDLIEEIYRLSREGELD